MPPDRELDPRDDPASLLYDGDKLRPPDPDEGPQPEHLPSWRLHNDWGEDPYASPEVQLRRRALRHRRWIALISARDWDRLAARADLVMSGARGFARFMDLDAPFDVQVLHPDERPPGNGERFGMLRGAVLKAFRKGGG